MSSARGCSPMRRDMNTTGYGQESDALHLQALQDDRKNAMAIGDPANPSLAMIGTWATENSHNVNPGRNSHGSNGYSSTNYDINGNLINHHGTNSHGQHTSIGPNFSIPNPKLAEMRHGPSYRLVPNDDPTAGVSQGTEATSNKPRRAYPEPMQRWADEIAKEQPRNTCGIEETSLRR